MKLIYVSKAFDGNIGATLHYKALKELYKEKNIITYDLRPITAFCKDNYKCPGKYKNYIDTFFWYITYNIKYELKIEHRASQN